MTAGADRAGAGHLIGWPYPPLWVGLSMSAGLALLLAGAAVLYRHVRRAHALSGLGFYAAFGLASGLLFGAFFRVVAPAPEPASEVALLVFRHLVVESVAPLWLSLGAVTLILAAIRNRLSPHRPGE
ncbi:hypothetical protein [Caulobacter sp. 17J65-9]|uniref:hypothetical protein n=1 Tax=Caulobacter sp. 17J65-9 TaxID=2709382 RepID=UPI0013C797D0|nr:hypothetical protein [Caulobacter sp. 17J65-9]NEX94696.1 hypothetical protein [Caulobacter sp. 17J65-9]